MYQRRAFGGNAAKVSAEAVEASAEIHQREGGRDISELPSAGSQGRHQRTAIDGKTTNDRRGISGEPSRGKRLAEASTEKHHRQTTIYKTCT
jgi:hypothetical protein